jgi:hypothetical protein
VRNLNGISHVKQPKTINTDAASAGSGVNNSGSLTQADKDAFIAGWMDRRVVNEIQIPDLVSFGQGDLNLDGITNIQDLVLMQAAISGSGSGMSPITAAELAGVPEPTGAAILALAIVPTLLRRRVRSAM